MLGSFKFSLIFAVEPLNHKSEFNLWENTGGRQ
uniref:Uncharacterized protein n=1 Tax=Arundo donax TaxID=35708 RepID=A0A0A8YJ97_ARUDO